MKCRACDCILSDFEATRKFAGSGTYVELCERDFRPIEGMVRVIERKDLRKGKPIGEDQPDGGEFGEAASESD